MTQTEVAHLIPFLVLVFFSIVSGQLTRRAVTRNATKFYAILSTILWIAAAIVLVRGVVLSGGK